MIQRLVLVLCTVLLVAAPAFAQDFPTKPVKLIVPWPQGGLTDVLSRLFAQEVSAVWKHPMIVENIPGANGSIGAGVAAKAAPDGYTLMMATADTHAINPSLMPNLSYDPLRDFVPIALMASQSLMLVVYPDFPAKNLAELLALARAKPGELRYASFGTGSTSHLAMELLEQRAKIDMIHVPYKGGGPALTDVMGGHVEMMFSGFPTAIPQVRAGKVRAIAVSSAKRSTIAPEIPTVAELGFPGFATEAWYGLSAPTGTPPAIIEKVRAAVNAALSKPEVRDLLLSRSVEIINVGPAEFAAFNNAEIQKWSNTLRTLDIKIQ